jgi:hypothetical protein
MSKKKKKNEGWILFHNLPGDRGFLMHVRVVWDYTVPGKNLVLPWDENNSLATNLFKSKLVRSSKIFPTPEACLDDYVEEISNQLLVEAENFEKEQIRMDELHTSVLRILMVLQKRKPYKP